MLTTISVLVKCGLPDHKLIAASHDRHKLLVRAQEHCPDVDLDELDAHGHAQADDLSECCIQEVELLT